jgi:Flp pilus assembly protein TadD
LDANRRRETALAYSRIADCYMRSGELAKAAKNLDNASRLDGKNSQFFNDRCYCYMKLKNFDEAYKSICMAISLTQNSSAISNNCAVAQLSKNGGLPTVTILDQIKKAFDLNRDDLRIVLNYCIIH